MIRPFNTRDLSKIMEIWLTTNIKAHPFLDESVFVNQYEQFMTETLVVSKSFVYELDGKIVGFVSVNENMLIAAINVDVDYQQKGIGEKLLDYVIDKYHVLSVQCYRENENAAAFFIDNGFEIITVIPNETTHFDEYLMTYQQDDTTRN